METSSLVPTFAGSSFLPSSLFDLTDLALLHHWCLVTSVSIVNTRKLDYIWQTLLPEVAFRHCYVMHSILSLTALHIAHLNPSKKNASLLQATFHHSKGLDGFRADMERICPENCDGLFANAVLTFFYAFLLFGNLADDYSGDTSMATRTSRILGDDWIPLVRGVETVLHPLYDHIRVGPLQSLLSLGNWDQLCLDANSDPYDKDFVQIRKIWDQEADAVVYNETLDLLRKCRMWIAQFEGLQIDDTQDYEYNRGWSGPFIWLFLAPERYFELLKQRQPPALVIFAWFGASLHPLNQYWWIEGCSERIVKVVSECLIPEFSSCIEAAKHSIISSSK